jgi:hypothetical protein
VTPTGPPLTEIGTSTSSGIRPDATAQGLLAGSWQQLVDDAEQIPDLRWQPYGGGANKILDKMRTDPQIAGLLMGLFLPIRRYDWHVDPNGASEQTATEFAEDMNLPLKDVPREHVGRTRDRFSHDDHLRHSLLAPVFGHMFFEQVGAIINGRFRLRKLAPRMPASLEGIEVNETGGLKAISQRSTFVNGAWKQIRIPVERLVAYVWEREAAQWTGRSILRACYGPWLVKQRLVRVDALKHERNGMGVPVTRQTVPEVNPDAPAKALQLAESIRAGEVAGAHLPYGFDLALEGVRGTLPDTMASIRYCDEVMARSVLMMFMMLGQTQSGSRALSESFIDYTALNQEAIADWYADITSAHVGEDWTDWNDGPTAQAPRIGYTRDESTELPTEDLVKLAAAGIINVSEEDEVALRERHNLPGISEEPTGTDRLEADLALGIVSKRTVAERRGYDWDEELKRITDERAAQQPAPPDDKSTVPVPPIGGN